MLTTLVRVIWLVAIAVASLVVIDSPAALVDTVWTFGAATVRVKVSVTGDPSTVMYTVETLPHSASDLFDTPVSSCSYSTSP